MNHHSDEHHPSSQIGCGAEPHGLTNEQLGGLYGPTPKREVPFLLTLEGRPALGALLVALALAWFFLFGR